MDARPIATKIKLCGALSKVWFYHSQTFLLCSLLDELSPTDFTMAESTACHEY